MRLDVAYLPPAVARDRRDERIEELERENAQPRARVDPQQALSAILEHRNQELEARLARLPGSSSKPPSSDPPGAPPPAPPKRKGRRRGGQPGHARRTRTLAPPEKVTRTQVVKPCTCRHRGGALHGEDANPSRHQVIEIPRVVATVDEHQLHSLVCDRCGTSTRAAMPDGVPKGRFGPRLQAMVSSSRGDYPMSKRQLENMLGDFFGVELANG
jgi:transposase